MPNQVEIDDTPYYCFDCGTEHSIWVSCDPRERELVELSKLVHLVEPATAEEAE